MQNLKIGFIGYGRHAQANLYPSLKILGIKLQAIATTSKESSEKGKIEQGAKNSYSNHIEMLETEDLDCVFISAKPADQYQLTLDALNHGVHVYVEKPVGFETKEAQEVADLSEKTGKHVQVGFMKRYAPSSIELENIIHKEEFGEIVTVTGTYGSRNFVTTSKEHLLFAAIHYVNLLTSLIGEFEEVKGYKNVIGDSISQSLVIKAKSGITASVGIVGTPSWTKLHEELYITGTNGYAHTLVGEKLDYHINPKQSDTPRWQVMDETSTNYSTVLTTSAGGDQDFYQKGFVPAIEAFLNCVKDNKEPIANAQDNVITMKACDLIIDAVSK
jgi:predicted dehydrogenase